MVGGEGRTPRGGGTGPRPTEGETDWDSAWKWGRKGLRMLPWSLHREPEDSRWGAVLGLWGSTSNLRAQRSLGWRHRQQHDRGAGATGVAQRTEEGHRRAGLGGKWGLRDQVEREEWEMWEHTQAGPDPGTQRVWPRAGCQ